MRFPLANRAYGQLVFLNIDMKDSSRSTQELSGQQARDLLARFHAVVREEVEGSGGRLGPWQSDGAMSFFGTDGDENPLIQSAERVARGIVDRLCREQKGVYARIGLDTSPARYFEDLSMITSEAATVAARLQGDGRRFSSGSVLLMSKRAYSGLGDEEKKRYRQCSAAGVEAWGYIPEGCGSWQAEVLPPSPFQSASTEPQPKRLTESVQNAGASTDPLWQRDPQWPFLDRRELFFVITATPMAMMGVPLFSLEVHGEWVRNNYLQLPLGTWRIFPEESIRHDQATFFVGESATAPPVQFCRFYRNGEFAFGDAGWSQMPGWAGAFYPEATWRPLESVLAFLRNYYAYLKVPGLIQVKVLIGNVAGCLRRTSPDRVPPPRAFIYDADVVVQEADVSETLSSRAAEALYRAILKASELPGLWVTKDGQR